MNSICSKDDLVFPDSCKSRLCLSIYKKMYKYSCLQLFMLIIDLIEFIQVDSQLANLFQTFKSSNSSMKDVKIMIGIIQSYTGRSDIVVNFQYFIELTNEFAEISGIINELYELIHLNENYRAKVYHTWPIRDILDKTKKIEQKFQRLKIKLYDTMLNHLQI
ncbi:hypothetical protein BLOT_000721 [Blomia tropicalis]|nr:hypothetical protein BLOT_000721 [Blomia tropicalis]